MIPGFSPIPTRRSKPRQGGDQASGAGGAGLFRRLPGNAGRTRRRKPAHLRRQRRRKFAYLPALNDSAEGHRRHRAIVRRELTGWMPVYRRNCGEINAIARGNGAAICALVSRYIATSFRLFTNFYGLAFKSAADSYLSHRFAARWRKWLMDGIVGGFEIFGFALLALVAWVVLVDHQDRAARLQLHGRDISAAIRGR